jgi:uncharacterized protein DUF3857
VSSIVQVLPKFSFVYVLVCAAALAQEPAAKPADTRPPNEKTAPAKSEEKVALPFQIQLLETHVRFESNGDSRKEVHTVVKINDLAGARQFSRLGFDYNRTFQQVEIPLVKVSHANGGTIEILPGAITDAPNPAVQDFPAYHDVRVKSVRILGLQDGDTIEYRVITTTTKHPLAPDFWLEHTFDRSGQALEENYELDLPASRTVRLQVNPKTPANSTQKLGEGDSARLIYQWIWDNREQTDRPLSLSEADIVLSTYESWLEVSHRLTKVVEPSSKPTHVVRAKALELTQALQTPKTKLQALYSFVSAQIKTVDLPVGARAFRTRSPDQILESGYGAAEDKFALLASLTWSLNWESRIALFGAEKDISTQLPRPSLLVNSAVLTHIPSPPHAEGNGLYSVCDHCGDNFWMAPALEVAPFEALPAGLRGRQAFIVNYMFDIRPFALSPQELPFSSTQRVKVQATIATDGTLVAKLQFALRGDNELLLREAFHQTPKERWKEVAGLLALSDGFRGTITNVTASDPMATKDPFTVEYELTQAKFVDWSKKPVRIPALLPQIALPDLPGKTAGKIDLGTPLDVQTNLKLQLPAGTTVQTPAATSVARDYATFASKYDGHLNTVSVSRHINFLKREIPTDRAGDYNAFLRAVQNDQAQVIVLLQPATEPGVKQ